MCGVLEVSRSGYYKYLGTASEHKTDKDFKLLAEVRQIHKETRGAYGSRRISKTLLSKGYDVGRCRARSLMKKAGISARQRKKFKKTTFSTFDEKFKSCSNVFFMPIVFVSKTVYENT